MPYFSCALDKYNQGRTPILSRALAAPVEIDNNNYYGLARSVYEYYRTVIMYVTIFLFDSSPTYLTLILRKTVQRLRNKAVEKLN